MSREAPNDIEIEQPIPQAERRHYEGQLWDVATELSTMRSAIEEHTAELYTEIEAMKVKANLHTQEVLRGKESEYWRIMGKIQTINEQEQQVQKALLDLEEGVATKTGIERLLPKKEVEGADKISRRKEHIYEEKMRLGMDPSEILYDIYGLYGSNRLTERETTHLTTGRHLKGVKGNLSSYDAAQAFYYYTADTHGGKVGYGKKGDSYVTKGGNKIRKR